VTPLDVHLITTLVRAGADVNTCGAGMAAMSPLLLTLLDKRGKYRATVDFCRLSRAWARVERDGPVDMEEEGEEEWPEWANLLNPVLLEAGAEVTLDLLNKMAVRGWG